MNIEVDEHDLQSISSAIAKLHKLRTALIVDNPHLRSSNVRWEKRLAALEKEYKAIRQIAGADLSELFKEGSGEFYVYAHCSPTSPLNAKENSRHLFGATIGLTHTPFYIGKGIGARCDDLNRNEGHRKIRQFLSKSGQEIQVIKLRENLNENAAFAYEGKLIDCFGLKYLSKHGMLVNLDEGMFANERRSLYPKGAAWYINRMKLKLRDQPVFKNSV